MTSDKMTVKIITKVTSRQTWKGMPILTDTSVSNTQTYAHTLAERRHEGFIRMVSLPNEPSGDDHTPNKHDRMNDQSQPEPRPNVPPRVATWQKAPFHRDTVQDILKNQQVHPHQVGEISHGQAEGVAQRHAGQWREGRHAGRRREGQWPCSGAIWLGEGPQPGRHFIMV